MLSICTYTYNSGRLLTPAKWILFTEKFMRWCYLCLWHPDNLSPKWEGIRRKYELELMHSGTCHPQVPRYCQRCHPSYLTRIYLSSDSTAHRVMTEPVNPLGLPIPIDCTDEWAYAWYERLDARICRSETLLHLHPASLTVEV